MSTRAYPCVLFPARYNGVYEGDPWCAVASTIVPPDAISGDPETMNWWDRWRDSKWVAVGRTPEKALANLVSKQPDAGPNRADSKTIFLDEIPSEALSETDFVPR